MRYLPFLLLSLFLSTSRISAQTAPELCNLADGQQIFARQLWQENRVTLVSWNSAETLRDLEIDFRFDTFEVVDWSPNCTYLLAQAGQSPALQQYIWAVDTGDLVGSLADTTYRPRLNWSSDEQYLVTQLERGGYLWRVPSNQQTLLTDQIDASGRSFYSVEFDPVYQQLLVVTTGSGNGVSAYDLSSGEQVGFFHIGERARPVSYRYYEGNRYLMVYSTYRESSFDGIPRGLAIWDRDTLNNIQLDPNYEPFALDSFGGFDIIGGPNSRYFVISDYGVYLGQLYIWDFQLPIGGQPYMPNYQQPLRQSGEIRLLGSDRLEIADWTLWAYSLTPARIRNTQINLETMQVLKTTEVGQSCTQPEVPEDLRWTCEVAGKNLSTYAGSNQATYWPPR
jgi:hypothetical protein